MAKQYRYDDALPLGRSARAIVTEYGRLRSAPLADKPTNLDALGVPRDVRPVLSISFEHSGGTVTYAEACGLTAPVFLTARLSTGRVWRSRAVLAVRPNSPVTVGFDAGSDASFYLSARLMGAETDISVEAAGTVTPIRFTTLCGTSVDTTTKKDFGSGLADLITLSQPAELKCAPARASKAGVVPPQAFAVKLVRYDEEACRKVHPDALPESFIALSVAADWSVEELLGHATFGREHNVPTLRYSVYGRARGTESLAGLLPCAPKDGNVSVELEGGVRGENPAQRERGKVTFSFTCEDVAVRCSTN